MNVYTCPLCCCDKFTSIKELREHVSSIKLVCPICPRSFENLNEYTEHLKNECTDESIKNEAINGAEVNEVNRAEEEENVEFVFLNPKQECEETEQQNEEDEHSVNVNDYSELEQENVDKENTESAEVEEVLYNCQMCNMNFTSIEEHLEKYHEGEEVLLETEDGEAAEMEEDTIIAVEEEEDVEPETPQPTNKNKTIEQSDCLDKDGRLYTRKVVKIDKFWMNSEDEPLMEPMTEKYVLENGKITKITPEEAEKLTNKDQIIEVFQCQTCYLQFPNSENYYKHKCNPAKNTTKFKCTYCSAVFLNYQSLNTHMKCHITRDPTGEVRKTVTLGPFLCNFCNTRFPSFKSLRLHKRMHDPIKIKEPEAPVNYSISGPLKGETVRTMFICNICNKTYDKEYEEIHMKSHTNDDNYDCKVCNRKFFTQENLDMHMKAHSNGKKFACSYCKKPFATHDALEQHVQNQCQKRLYECQYCGRRFARPHEKVKHERIHTGEKPHVCEICGKAFRVSYCLTLHMRTHSGTRPYQCSHCSKRFKSHSVYNHHLLTHSDERNYKCPYCPKAFKTSVQLAGHKNSHIKPFACTECNRPFASLYAVRAHMETHKRENNLKYECFLCGASYARPFALRDHMKNQHDDGGAENEQVLMELETVVSTSQIENEMQVEEMKAEEGN